MYNNKFCRTTGGKKEDESEWAELFVGIPE